MVNQNDIALIASSENGNLEIVKVLIQSGADIHAQDDKALSLSSLSGHLEIVKYLIENGADIHRSAALFMSSIRGHLEVVKYLIQNGADIHAYNDEALVISSKNGHLEIVKYLIENGADIHADNDKALVMSSKDGHLEIVKYLIEKGVDIHAQDDRALILSSQNGHLEIVKYLIENGADIHADNDKALVMSSKNGRLRVVKYLIENGANIHADNDKAIMMSSKKGRLRVVKYLVENGANPNIGLRYSKKNSTIYNFLKKYRKDNEEFKNAAIKILSNIKLKNENYFYKWQKLCNSLKDKNLTEIQNIGNIHNIDTKNMSKRQICKSLSHQYDIEMLKNPTCYNDTTILGDDIKLIPKPLLITIDEGKFSYCFNIIELIELINTGNGNNPYTRNKLPIEEIKNKMGILRKILIKDKLSLVNILDEIKNNEIMSKESILKLKIVNLIALLKYTPHINDIVTINSEKINKMFNLLSENPLMHIFGVKSLENLINESLRVLKIDDIHTNTRKAAYEIYLNEVFNEENSEE